MIMKLPETASNRFRVLNLLSSVAIEILLLSTVLLGGCGGLHLHNSADEELARKASDAFKAADVSKFIESERKALIATNERDLGITRRNVMAERDAAIIAALSEGQSVEPLLTHLKGRLSRIGIPKDTATQKVLYRLEDERVAAMVALDAYLVAISGGKIKPPSFPPTAEDEQLANDSKDSTLLSVFNIYRKAAKLYTDDLATLDNQEQGLIGNLNQKIKIGNELKTELNKEGNKKKAALENLVRKYKEEAKDTTKDVEKLRGEIEQALKDFDTVASSFEQKAKEVGLEDLLAEIHLEKLAVARDQVGKFLGAYAQESLTESQTATGGTRSEADLTGRAAAILVQTTKDIQDSSTRAKLVPLVFEQERLKLEIDRVQRAKDRGQQRLALLARQRAVLIEEGIKLVGAVNALSKASEIAINNEVKAIRERLLAKPEDAKHVSNDMKLVLADPDLTKEPTKEAKARLKTTGQVKSFLADPDAKGEVVHAFFLWAESIAIDKLQQEAIEVALISLDHDEALDASEFALSLWKHMIASPLDELVGYHASGLKSEDIANLIHAAGLAGIAVGVNR